MVQISAGTPVILTEIRVFPRVSLNMTRIVFKHVIYVPHAYKSNGNINAGLKCLPVLVNNYVEN
jgi:hypothetical protein